MPKETENAAHLRAHDYAWLVKRWRALAKREGWKMRQFAEADGFPVYVVESPPRPGPKLYLSAGIHGDEPASTEALVAWCAKRAGALKRCEVLIFPCLNPWGLQHNNRNDAHGRDLNRGYHRNDVTVIEAQKKIVRGRFFDAAVMLHEDFDAHGVYLYEIPGARPFWGEKLLAAAAKHVQFLERIAAARAKVTLAEPTVTALGPGLWRVETSISNTGRLPTVMRGGRAEGVSQAHVVRISVPVDRIRSGKRVQVMRGLDAGAQERFTWIVSAAQGEPVTVEVVHAGRIEASHVFVDGKRVSAAGVAEGMEGTKVPGGGR